MERTQKSGTPVTKYLKAPQIRMVDSDNGAFIKYLNGGLRMKATTFRHENIAFELPEIAALLP